MADSMCGPSNALKQFQQHSQADRSLQQDRLVNRAPQSQGFRSAAPSNQNVEAELHAFQNGQLPGFEAQGLAPTSFHPQQRMNQAPQAGSAKWANDFQNMHISQQPIQHQGMPQQAQGGWHQEFAQQNQTAVANHGHSTPVERLAGIQAQPYGGQMSMYQGSMMNMRNQGFQNYQPPPMQQEQMQPAQAEAFDEEAFARAFDQAAQQEIAGAMNESAQLSQEIQDQGVEGRLEQPIGADAIHHPDGGEQQRMTPAQESDDLARTAEQLLHSVQDNTTDKFQNSVFLQLMRQLRDKEVVVEGDQIRPANGGGSQDTWSSSRPRNDYHRSGISDMDYLSGLFHNQHLRDGTADDDMMDIDIPSRPEPLRQNSQDLFTPTTDLRLPHNFQAHRTPVERSLSPSEELDSLKQTRNTFKSLKVQFENIEEKQRLAKEELRQEALRLWKEELALEGRTWGEASS